jgi:hypothetical protein
MSSANPSKSVAPTLVIADYPIGYTSGFGETLYNLFTGFPSDKLWTAHPAHVPPAAEKTRATSVNLSSPSRPHWLPNRISLAYYPVLKVKQVRAARESLRLLANVVQRHSIQNLLVIPVSPWILSAALALHKQNPKLNLVVYVMDDWQGHHECHGLPYSQRRQRLLSEVIDRANVCIAVSREMATHYEEIFEKTWRVAHNGVRNDALLTRATVASKPQRIFLAGDVNVFRFDAVIAFAEAIERFNQRCGASIALRAVKLLNRQSHSECLQSMKTADLLYLPLAFSQRSARISLYSLPTKLPEYLASGKSVLFHAPKESAVFQVAERYDLKPRLSSVDPKALDAFFEMWPNGNGNSGYAESNAQRALLEEFDIERLAARFQSAFV